ncbi:mitochondrial genome maintenance exonuclease 1-like [Polistes fuscatus]|uniref:mitochondrial genome maintenance exonuclease 1-like n=1 Tax=Polistes fuscatus TaxID=30207 RepID=UPI001CA80366|nr:mitochondrial genome maintenance exonuclease 1-like [Polistes fuscatus]
MNRFPIFTEQQKIPKVLEQSEILSLSLKDDPEILYYPSVTKILSETMTPEAQKILNLWKNKLIREMGEEKFNEYQQELLNNGKIFHSCIQDTLYGREVDIPEHILPAYNSLSSIINELQDIRAVESFVSHKGLCYKGKVDCIATYRDKLCVIDWKKSDKDKKNVNLTYDAPIQLAAYVGAINSSKSYPFSIHYAMIVVGYTTGKPADTFFLSDHHLNEHWSRWLAKLRKYWHNVKNQNNCSD